MPTIHLIDTCHLAIGHLLSQNKMRVAFSALPLGTGFHHSHCEPFSPSCPSCPSHLSPRPRWEHEPAGFKSNAMFWLPGSSESVSAPLSFLSLFYPPKMQRVFRCWAARIDKCLGPLPFFALLSCTFCSSHTSFKLLEGVRTSLTPQLSHTLFSFPEKAFPSVLLVQPVFSPESLP